MEQMRPQQLAEWPQTYRQLDTLPVRIIKSAMNQIKQEFLLLWGHSLRFDKLAPNRTRRFEVG